MFIFGQKSESVEHLTGKELIALADKYLDISPENAFEYAEKALEFSLKNQNKEIEAQAYNYLAGAKFILGDFEKALEYSNLAEQLLLSQNNKYLLASLYSNKASGYMSIGDFEKFEEYSNKALEFAKRTNNRFALTAQYNLKAQIAYNAGDLSTAIEFLSNALVLRDETPKVSKNISICCDLLGIIFSEYGIYDKALEYTKRAIDYAEKLELHRLLIHYYNHISQIYNQLEQFDSSYIFCQKSLKACEKINIEPLKATSYSYFAKCFAGQNQYDSAKYYIDKAIKISEQYNIGYNSITYYSEAGDIYFAAGDYEKSLFYAKDAYEMAEEASVHGIKHSTQKLFGNIYYLTGMYDLAAHYYHQYIKGDTLKNMSNSQEALIKQEEQRIREIAAHEIREAQSKRKILLYFLYLCTFFIGGLIFLVRLLFTQRNKIHQINKELNDHKDELELLIDYKNKLLEDKEHQYSNLCNNMFNGAVFRMEFDENEIEAGRVVFLSSGWQRLTGQKDVNIIFFDDNVFHADREMLYQTVKKTIRSNSNLDVVFRYYKENNIYWFHVRGVAYMSLDGVIYLDGYLVDETEQKHFEKQLLEAKEKAEESDRLKSAFLNNISHEIRTPMNGIMGFSNLILNDQIPEQDKSEFLKAINDNCFQLLQIINDIVELSKIETNQMIFRFNDFKISEINDDIKLFIFPIYKEKYPHIDFIVDQSFYDLSDNILKVDKSCLLKIFEYLIANAAKFTPQGHVKIGVKIQENEILFYVSDTGIGIAQQFYDIIFDNFMKLNPQLNSGTGLGLPIVKRLLTKMGGNIWVESEIGTGSTFTFTIPLINLPVIF